MAKKEVNKVEETDLEKAAKLLEEENKRRKQACWEDVEKVLVKHGFTLGIVFDFALTPKQK